MSWLNKVILLVPLLLTACGFQPLYGKKNTDAPTKVLAGVRMDPIPGRMGQQLKADLEDKLNPSGAVPPDPFYRLQASIESTTAPIGVARDGTISRYNVYLNSKYVLYRNDDGSVVTSGTVRHVSSFNNVTNAYFSTYVSEADAISRGITELGEVYRQRLSAYLSQDGADRIAAKP